MHLPYHLNHDYESYTDTVTDKQTITSLTRELEQSESFILLRLWARLDQYIEFFLHLFK